MTGNSLKDKIQNEEPRKRLVAVKNEKRRKRRSKICIDHIKKHIICFHHMTRRKELNILKKKSSKHYEKT